MKPNYLTEEAWGRMPVFEKAMHIASGEVGVREIGFNNGEKVLRFLKAVGLGPGFAWCAAFVYWTLLQAGANPKLLPSKWTAGRVSTWDKWAKATGRHRQVPRRGDLGYWLNPDGTGHTFWVTDYDPGTQEIKTVEGNTNDGRSREGDGVYRHSRTIKELASRKSFGFIRLGALS